MGNAHLPRSGEGHGTLGTGAETLPGEVKTPFVLSEKKNMGEKPASVGIANDSVYIYWLVVEKP